MVAGVIVLLTGITRIISATVIWRLLRKHPWQLYTCTSLMISEESRRVRMHVTDHAGTTFWIRTDASRRRRESLHGMTRPEIWLAGDPATRAIVTPAGGPEIFYARRAMSARANARAAQAAARRLKRKPPKPRKPPKRTDARTAREDRRRDRGPPKAYTAARAKAAAKRAANPPKPRLPRRGSKINWMG